MGILIKLEELQSASEHPVLDGEYPVNDVYAYLVKCAKDIYTYIVYAIPSAAIAIFL